MTFFSFMRQLCDRAVPAVGMALVLAGSAAAQEAMPAEPHVPLQKTIGVPHADRPIPSLAVINAAGARLDNGKLVLTGVTPNVIVFADRPVRAAGHEMLGQFLTQWDEGHDSFSADPPNATVSVLGAKPGEVSDTVLVLKAPKLEGTTLTFDVATLEGKLASGGPVAVFIDAWAVRGPYGGGAAHWGGYGGGGVARWGGYGGGVAHWGGYYHAPVYHGAWYARPYPAAGAAAVGLATGAVIGAAAADAARPPVPACGYYPYPPCY